MMKPFVLPLLALAVMMVSGCAGSRARLGEDGYKKEVASQLADSDSRYKAATSKTYKGKSVEEIVAAARKVLMLWDKDRVTITDSLNGFTAVRQAPWYAPTTQQQGETKWGFRTVADGFGGVTATTSEITMITVVNRGQFARHMARDDGLATYALFWKRVDYVLGLSTEWPTCAAFDKERKASAELSKGNLKPLCGTMAKDEVPEALRVTK